MAYNDNDLIVSVSAKDADTGHRYIVPAPKLPASLDPAHATAAMSGWYRELISPAQNAATKAKAGKYTVEREGKQVSLSEREAVQHFVTHFRPSPDRELPTIGNKRMEITREMVSKALAARGLDSGDASVEANIASWLAGPKGTKANAATVEKALDDFLATPYRVTKRGTGGTKDGEAPKAEAQDW